MVAKCANPNCSKPFLYLHEGRVFVLQCSGKAPGGLTPRDNDTKYAWLCHECAGHLIVRFDAEEGMKLVRKEDSPKRQTTNGCAVTGGMIPARRVLTASLRQEEGGYEPATKNSACR
jgi:hypothetical protein